VKQAPSKKDPAVTKLPVPGKDPAKENSEKKEQPPTKPVPGAAPKKKTANAEAVGSEKKAAGS